jgi:hypothetical protein
LILTTDHGTINVKNPSKVVGDKIPVSIWDTKPDAAYLWAQRRIGQRT